MLNTWLLTNNFHVQCFLLIDVLRHINQRNKRSNEVRNMQLVVNIFIRTEITLLWFLDHKLTDSNSALNWQSLFQLSQKYIFFKWRNKSEQSQFTGYYTEIWLYYASQSIASDLNRTILLLPLVDWMCTEKPNGDSSRQDRVQLAVSNK